MAVISSKALPLEDVVVSDGVLASLSAQIVKPQSFVMAIGPTGSGRATALRAAAIAASQRVLEVDVSRLSQEAVALKRQLSALARESTLLGCTILLRNIDALAERAETRTERLQLLATELLDAVSGPVLASAVARPVGLRSARRAVIVELGPLGSAQRATLWRRAFPGCVEGDIQCLSARYAFAPSVICAVGQAALARCDDTLTESDLMGAIEAVVDDRLAGLATRIDVTQSWDDLVLPPDQMASVVELLARVRERTQVYENWGFSTKLGKGVGVSALLSGPPGTGKTMAASLIAKDLGLALYRVDLAQMVSKFIGETEKNLSALFDAAESGQAVLLFDEADSLFGKRTEVKSSNDRYANLEVNYLLQRLETFTGICLLTTNHENAIDPAFQRRLAFHIRFPVPDEAEREQLWRALIPSQTPLDPGVNFGDLARGIELSGGQIRNAVLRAAFLAADEGTSIAMSHLWSAATIECEATGKIAPRPSILSQGARPQTQMA